MSVGTLRKTIQSGKWVLATTISNKAIGFVSFLILARLLDPKSYGIIAIVFMAAGILSQLTESGFEKALIQKKEDIEKYLDTVWTWNFLKSLVIFFLFFFGAPVIARFFNAADAVNIIRWGGVFAVFPALVSIRQVFLFRDFYFDRLYYRDLAGQIAFVIVGVLWALFVSRDAWALFFGNAAKYLASLGVVYYYFPSWPKFELNFRALRELFGYGKWIMGQNIVSYFASYADILIIGHSFTPAVLGLYTRAANLGALALSLVSSMTKSLSFVAFSKVQDAKDKISAGFLMALDLLFFLGLLNIFLWWFGADPVVHLFLGEKWLGIVPPIKIFTVSAMFAAITALAYSLFDGAGKPQIGFKMKIASAAAYAVLSYIGIQYKSMVGAAIGVTAANILMALFVFYKMKRVYDLSFSVIAGRFLVVFAPLLLVTAGFWPVFRLFPKLPDFATILILAAYILIYVGVFWLVGKRYRTGFWTTFDYIVKSLKP